MQRLTYLASLLLCTGVAWAEPLSFGELKASLPQSPAWQGAQLGYQMSQDQFASAQAALGLGVNVGSTVDQAWSKLHNPIPPATTTDWSGASSGKLTAKAQINVFPWSSVGQLARRAYNKLMQAQNTLEQSRNQLTLALFSAYNDWLSASDNLKLLQATVELRTTQLAHSKQQLALGLAIKTQVDQAAIALDEANINLEQGRNQLDIALLALSEKLGQPQDTTATPTTTDAVAQPSSLQDWLAKSAQRTDVKNAQVEVQNAHQDGDYADQVRWVPDVAVSLGYSGPDTTLGGSVDLKSGILGLSASQNLWNDNKSGQPAADSISLRATIGLDVISGTSDATVNAYHTAQTLANNTLERTLQAAQLDITSRYNAWQQAEKVVGLRAQSVRLQQDTLANTKARLAANTAVALEVTAAELNLMSAVHQHHIAKRSAYIAWLQLNQSTGQNLWEIL